MDDKRFDQIARALGGVSGRRQAVRSLFGGAAASALGAFGLVEADAKPNHKRKHHKKDESKGDDNAKSQSSKKQHERGGNGQDADRAQTAASDPQDAADLSAQDENAAAKKHRGRKSKHGKHGKHGNRAAPAGACPENKKNQVCHCPPGQKGANCNVICVGNCSGHENDPWDCVCPGFSCESGVNLPTCASCGEGDRAACTTVCQGSCTDDKDCATALTGCHCFSGTCQVGCGSNPPCTGDDTCCSGSCVDLDSNASNCGRCGNTCGGGQVCSGGKCVCEGNTKACGDQCIPITDCCTNDEPGCAPAIALKQGNAHKRRRHKGKHAQAQGIAATLACCNGVCCTDSDQVCCSNTCTTLGTDDNCASCGDACTGGATCIDGSCKCPSGTTLCNGNCVSDCANGQELDPATCTCICTANSCSNGCCVGTTCDTTKKACGQTCIDNNACCTNDTPGCPPNPICHHYDCTQGNCDLSTDSDGSDCGDDNVCCGGDCVQCCSNADCPEGDVCSGDHTCVPSCQTVGETCDAQNPCCAGLLCNPTTGTCQLPCSDQNPCGENEICCGGICVADGICCTGDNPGCTEGEVCCSGTCHTGVCCGNGDCAVAEQSGKRKHKGAGPAGLVGEVCCNHECVECCTSQDCPPGDVCSTDHTCVPSCQTVGETCDAQNPCCQGLICDPTSNTCQPPAHCGTGPACTGDQVCCGEGDSATCVDLGTDQNCARCGDVCTGGTHCVDGTCQETCGGGPACTEGLTCCGEGDAAQCVDTGSDNDNCGTCGTICPENTTCTDSSCNPICAGAGDSCAEQGCCAPLVCGGADGHTCVACTAEGGECSLAECCSPDHTCKKQGKKHRCVKAGGGGGGGGGGNGSGCFHVGGQPVPGKPCCPRLHEEHGRCVINRWDHCDQSNKGQRSWCEHGTTCEGGRISPHHQEVCVPKGYRRRQRRRHRNGLGSAATSAPATTPATPEATPVS